MHNRVGPARDIVRHVACATRLVLVPLVLAILAFALYPQRALDDAEPAVRAAVAPVLQAGGTQPAPTSEVRAVIGIAARSRARTSTGRRCRPSSR